MGLCVYRHEGWEGGVFIIVFIIVIIMTVVVILTIIIDTAQPLQQTTKKLC